MGDLFIVVVLLPLLSVGSWWTVRRIWVTGHDVTSGSVQLLPTASRAGASASRLPMAICFTTGSLGCLANLILGGSTNAMTAVGSFFLTVGLLALVMSGWMLLFAWPRFLVPPAFRGEPGWVVTQFRRVSRRRGEPAQGGAHKASDQPSR